MAQGEDSFHEEANPVYVDYIPSTKISFQKENKNYVLHVLLDSGSTTSWIRKSALQGKDVNISKIPPITGTTMAGNFQADEVTTLHELKLQELHPHRTIECLTLQVFDAPCRYDAIIGREVLSNLGIILDFNNKTIEWDDKLLPMRMVPNPSASSKNNDDAFRSDTLGKVDNSGYHSKTITASNYEKVDVGEVVNSCFHLSSSQKRALKRILRRYETLFDGKLKVFPNEKIHLDIDPTVAPHRARTYPVPRTQLDVFKKELDRLEQEGVLSKTGRSEWIAGSFIIPKKDGSVRWISDFRALNKAIKRKAYPIPRIGDILSRRTGYKFLTKLDISMQYYTFELDDESKNLCVIATPFGLYRYNRLPMGLSISPDAAQEIMERVLSDIKDIEIYIDDIACFSNSWDDHLALLEQVLTILQKHNFTINPRKCEWAVKETDFLGYWLTPTGIKPWKKKVDSILRMQKPRNVKELRSFLGLVNFYRDMWPKRSHVLAPLTNMTGKTIFEWTEACDKAFDEMKALAAMDTLLRYPDHNKPFHIETDSSDYQLGAVILQEGQPVAYYSRKLTPAQMNYTTIEKELLSIVETLKTFRTMLYGAELHIHTDHKNLTYSMTQYTTQRVLRWRLLLEDFGAKFHYKNGKTNVVADALSRVPRMETSAISPAVGESIPPTDSFFDHEDYNKNQSDEYYFGPCAESNCLLTECLLFYPRFDNEDRYPFDFNTIMHYQNQDEMLQALLVQNPNMYKKRLMGGADVICVGDTNSGEASGQIALPQDMVVPILKYYHGLLGHAEAATKLEKTVRRHFFHPSIGVEAKRLIAMCDLCKRMKHSKLNYGELPIREITHVLPWQQVHVDMVGPWKLKVNKTNIKIEALTCIEPVLNLLEIYRCNDKKGNTVARAFENGYLSRYPRPLECVHDNGSEFICEEFQTLLKRAGIRSKPTTSNNPQSNGVIEAVHKTVGQVLRTYIELKPPKNQDEVETMIDSALATAMHACRCSAHLSLGGFSPGALTFGRDMLLDIPLIADMQTLIQARQAKIDNRLLQANKKRKPHDFRVGQRVYLERPRKPGDKLRPLFTGPHDITRVHTNGTVTLRRGPNLMERVNIRRIKPE